MVDGLVKLFFTERTIGPINLGNPEPIPIKDLAKEIIELTNSQSKIVFETLPTDDPVMREPDISKAIRHLGWSPKINRAVGVKSTIQYFRSQI